MKFLLGVLRTVLMIVLVRLAFNPLFSFLLGVAVGVILGVLYTDEAQELISKIPYALELLRFLGINI